MIVVDASAILAVLVRTETFARIDTLIFGRGETLHAPHLIDAEVTQVLRRLSAAGEITAAFGSQAVDNLRSLEIIRYPHGDLLNRAWSLRHNLTVYDAMYVTLAEALDAPLVTRDRKMRDAPGHSARVELV